MTHGIINAPLPSEVEVKEGQNRKVLGAAVPPVVCMHMHDATPRHCSFAIPLLLRACSLLSRMSNVETRNRIRDSGGLEILKVYPQTVQLMGPPFPS